jgi:hypothetical protein
LAHRPFRGYAFKNVISQILILASPAVKGENFDRRSSASPSAAGVTSDTMTMFGSILNPTLALDKFSQRQRGKVSAIDTILTFSKPSPWSCTMAQGGDHGHPAQENA